MSLLNRAETDRIFEELNKMINELEQLREYRQKWSAVTDYLKDENGNGLRPGDLVSFKVDTTHWGENHRKSILPENLEFEGQRIYAKMTGTIDFDSEGRQFCINTDNEFLPSIYISCIKEGSLELCIGKDLCENKENFDEEYER